MVYRCIRYWFILFVILMFGFFTPYDVQAELTNEIMEQEAISGRENMVLVQYISGFDSRRNMAADRAVRSRCAINPEVELLELDESVDTAEYIMKLKENPHVRFVERNKKLRLFSFPNDPYYSSQWALTQIQAVEAWELLPPGQQDIIVAVIDSGIKSNHLDLCNRISPGGYNFLLNNHDINDVQGHGTAVAGVIAAETNNGIGIAGVAGPNRVKILPLKTSDSEGYSYLSDVIAAIDYAIEQQVKVINISMGSPKYSEIENAAIQRAINKGICVVAAAGNDGNSSYNYPASHPGVISVGSIKPDCLVSHFSNYNDKVDLTAPGEDVYSCSYDGSYRSVTGTSFSAPIVSATAALLITANPALTPSEIENILGQSAVDLGTPGKDPYYGYGVVNAFSALEQIVQVPVSSISLDKEALELQVGESYTLAATIYPTNASNPQIAWASDNTDVATVDANGKVTAISEGNATIIAVSADGGKIASCYLTVIPDYIAVEELLLDKQQLLLQVGESYALQAGLNPFNATIKEVSWATDNPAVAVVDDSGMVSAVGAGAATIIAISADGGKMAVCQVTVLQISVENRSITMAPGNVEPALSDNSWFLKIEGARLKNQLTSDDFYCMLPAGLSCMFEIQGDRLQVTVSGKTENSITISTPVELVIRGSAFDGNFDSCLAPIQLMIEPVEDCFIATAAFGSYLDPHVYVLREFRDAVLLKSHPGRLLVAQYYRYSPPIAAVIAEYDGLGLLIRVLLTPVVYACVYPGFSLVIICILLLIVLRVKRLSTNNS